MWRQKLINILGIINDLFLLFIELTRVSWTNPFEFMILLIIAEGDSFFLKTTWIRIAFWAVDGPFYWSIPHFSSALNT